MWIYVVYLSWLKMKWKQKHSSSNSNFTNNGVQPLLRTYFDLENYIIKFTRYKPFNPSTDGENLENVSYDWHCSLKYVGKLGATSKKQKFHCGGNSSWDSNVWQSFLCWICNGNLQFSGNRVESIRVHSRFEFQIGRLG